jgi:hypothetical protein
MSKSHTSSNVFIMQNNTLLNRPVLISGVYRSGTTFANAAISCFTGYSSLSSGLKFMRFCYGKYGEEVEHESQLKSLLVDCQKRLARRWAIKIPVDNIFTEVMETGLSYSTIYDVLVRDILGIRQQGSSQQWCDKLVLNWDLAETFLELFPDGVVVHVVRSPLDVLKSYQRMTSEPNPIYLDAIFNCYSSFVFAESIAKKEKERIIICKSQDFADPNSNVYSKLSNLLDCEFNEEKFNLGNFNTLIDQWNINSTVYKSLSISRLRNTNNRDEYFTDIEKYLLEQVCGKFMDEYAFPRNYIIKNISSDEIEYNLDVEYLIRRYRLAVRGEDPGPSYFTDPVSLERNIVDD